MKKSTWKKWERNKPGAIKSLMGKMGNQEIVAV